MIPNLSRTWKTKDTKDFVTFLHSLGSWMHRSETSLLERSLAPRHVRSKRSSRSSGRAGAASAFDSRPRPNKWKKSNTWQLRLRLQLVGIETLCHLVSTWNTSSTNHMFGGSNPWWFGFSIFVGHRRWCSPHLHHHSCLASVCLRSRPVSERGLHTVYREREHLQSWELFLETRWFHVCCWFEDMASGLCTVVSSIYDHR